MDEREGRGEREAVTSADADTVRAADAEYDRVCVPERDGKTVGVSAAEALCLLTDACADSETLPDVDALGEGAAETVALEATLCESVSDGVEEAHALLDSVPETETRGDSESDGDGDKESVS